MYVYIYIYIHIFILNQNKETKIRMALNSHDIHNGKRCDHHLISTTNDEITNAI